MFVNSSSFIKGRPSVDPCPSLVDQWTISTRLGPVFDPRWTVAHLWILWTSGASFLGFFGPLVNFWLDRCWTVLYSWVISSFGFQLEFFVSLPCSEGFKWVLSLEISPGWLEIGNNGRFTRIKSPQGRIVGSRGLPR